MKTGLNQVIHCGICKKKIPNMSLRENGGPGLCPNCFPDKVPSKIKPVTSIKIDGQEVKVLERKSTNL